MVETRRSRKLKILESLNNNAQLDRSLDPLSALPDTVLINVLSLAPAITAVATSILSTRWRYLWTQLTNICVDSQHLLEQIADLYPVVDQLLTRNTSPRLDNFSIRVLHPRQQHFELWLSILATRIIQNISITVQIPYQGLYADMDSPLTLPRQGDYASSGSPFTLPPSIFQTPSLVSLILPPNCVNYDFPSNTRAISKLPNLIKLELCLRASHCGFVAKLVRSCPLLEDFSLTAVKPWNNGSEDDDNGPLIDISARNLKRLKLDLLPADENTKVVINAPKLDWFYLIASQLASCSFVRKPTALREALILTRSEASILSLRSAISNVTKLHIYVVSLNLFEDLKDNQANSSNFHNLADLTLELDNDVDSLDSFPFTSTPRQLLLRAKSVKVEVKYNGKLGEKLAELAKFLGCNAPILETLTFHPIPVPNKYDERVNNRLEETLLCIDLYSCLKNSLGCRIEFEGRHARLPVDKTALKKMEENVKVIREYLSLKDTIAAL